MRHERHALSVSKTPSTKKPPDSANVAHTPPENRHPERHKRATEIPVKPANSTHHTHTGNASGEKYTSPATIPRASMMSTRYNGFSCNHVAADFFVRMVRNV